MAWDLIAVGDVLLDVSLPELRAGERAHGRIELRAGGSATNVALAAARLGARAAVVGRIGRDPAGRLVADELASAGVEPLLAEDEERGTGIFAAAGSAIVADPGASLRLAPADVPKTLEASAVLVSGYALLQEGSEAAARAALDRARAPWLAVDAASAGLVGAFGRERFFEVTAPANVLLANADEARALTGLDAEDAAVALAERFRIACVKLGREGAIAATEGSVVRVAPEPLEDPVAIGAGDAFAAGFLLALVHDAKLEVAVGAGCDEAVAALRRLPSRGGADARA
jgi:sugar/nucleoside kinase (ribokinase family)